MVGGSAKGSRWGVDGPVPHEERTETGAPGCSGGFAEVLRRLDRIESALDSLAREGTARDHYTTAEIAQILGKAEFTVREWCRTGRIHARKRLSGRGPHAGWVIGHEELGRIRREGLLPLQGSESRDHGSGRVHTHRNAGSSHRAGM